MELIDLKDEIRNDFYISKDRKKIWNIELDLLMKLDEVCKKNNLKYYIDAGTLLGAVRHKGFIPWDDDIDVVMFRKDYDKLVSIAIDEFKDPYFFQCAYTEKNYGRGHAQLRNSNTTAILESERKYNVQYNQGIFIDIFILDAVPNNQKDIIKEKKTIKILNYLINLKMYQPKKINSLKNGVKIIISKFINLKFLFKIKEKILKSRNIEDVEYVAPLGFIFETEKRIRSKHLYDEVILMDFEKIKLEVPKNYDVYLRHRYGDDYMKPRNIPTTHGDVLIDVEKSYKEYLEKERK